jgi:hypothetical protein
MRAARRRHAARLRPVGVFPFPRDAIAGTGRRQFDLGGAPAPGRPAPRTASMLQAENFALGEEVRQMEARLEAVRAMRGWNRQPSEHGSV